MADLERTAAGWQHLIDGCDKRTLPRSTTPVDDCGQGLLGYYKPPSVSEILQHKLAAPLRGKRAQRPLTDLRMIETVGDLISNLLPSNNGLD